MYKNVMELLVEEEVGRQFRALSPRMASYIKQTELAAYALNQLPALYATSEKGLEYQLEKGRAKFASQITQAVQRAIAAVSRDPLRAYQPLQLPQANALREVLTQLRSLLRNDQVDWENLPAVLEQALNRASQGDMWEDYTRSRTTPYAAVRRASASYPRRSSAFPSAANAAPPRSSASELSHSEQNRDPFSWDNPLYQSH